MKIINYAATALLFSVGLTFAQAQGLTTQEKFDQLQAAGIFSGLADDTSQLEEQMNRAQFARVAALVLGLDQDTDLPQNPFTDIGGVAWTEEEITAGAQFSMPMDGKFNPSGDISLEQLARVVVVALGLDETMDRDAKVEGASDWAQAYVAAAIQAGLIPESTDYTQPTTRSSLVEVSFVATTAILGKEALDQDMVDPDDANPQGDVSNQDLAGMLGSDQNASVPGQDDPSQAADSLASNDQIANEVLIDQLVQESIVLAAANADPVAMYPYFDAGFITPPSDMPFTGTALYNGRASGAFSNGTALNGDLTMVADFSAEQIASSIFFDNNMGAATFTIHQAGNSLSSVSGAGGSYGASLDPNPLTVTGVDINGMFYGPAAEEVGGTWGIDFDGGSASADGTFNGKR